MKRKITIGYKPGSTAEIPMIRITNKYLPEYGFKVGDEAEIEYKPNELIIRKVGAHQTNKNRDKNNGNSK